MKRLLTLSFILSLSVSSFAFADDYGQDQVSTEGAICEQRSAQLKADEEKKKQEDQKETVIKS